jgi:protein ImuA
MRILFEESERIEKTDDFPELVSGATRATDRAVKGALDDLHPIRLTSLRRRIRALETPSLEGEGGAVRRLRFGVPAIDEGLPWGGLALGGLHEIIEARDSAGGGAALGFCAALLARLSGPGGTVLWCRRARNAAGGGELYAPGLANFGLAPERLILVRARNDDDLLWAMQEGLRCGRLAAVVGEPRKLGFSNARRLQLAAESRGVPGFLLRPPGARHEPGAALTRWRLGALPGEALSSPSSSLPSSSLAKRPRWRAELLRVRGGSPNVWFMEWCHETRDFSLVAPLCDRSAKPALRRLAV